LRAGSREKSGSEKRRSRDNWWLLAWPALAITPGCVRDKSCKEHNGARQSDPAGLSGSAPFNAPQPDLQIRSLAVIIRRRERDRRSGSTAEPHGAPATAKSRALTGDKSLSRRLNSLLRAYLPAQFTLSCFPATTFASWESEWALHKMWPRKTPIATDINQLMDADQLVKYLISLLPPANWSQKLFILYESRANKYASVIWRTNMIVLCIAEQKWNIWNLIWAECCFKLKHTLLKPVLMLFEK
jgi:hypothetical protein